MKSHTWTYYLVRTGQKVLRIQSKIRISPWQKKEVRGLVSSHPIQYPSDINGWSQSLNNNDLYFQQITFDCLASECSGGNYSIEDKQEIKIGVWFVANKRISIHLKKLMPENMDCTRLAYLCFKYLEHNILVKTARPMEGSKRSWCLSLDIQCISL